MRAVTYARVSTEEQAERGYSLEDQVERCVARARELGAGEVEVFRDVESGSVLARPGLSAARQVMAAGGVDLFVCYDPDRLARNLSHQLLLTEEIESRGVRLEFVNFEWRNTAEGKLFYSLRGAIAEYEKEKIKERSARGKLRKLREGRLIHDPRTYGYRFDAETDTLTVDSEAAEVVRKIFSWYADEGLGYSAIVARLDALGIPPPCGGKVWHKSTVSRILRNTAYVGCAYYHRYNSEGVRASRRLPAEARVKRKERPRTEWVAVPVPQIVDSGLFQRAQERHASIRRLYAGKSQVPYLLSGLVECGMCGGRIHGNLITGRNGKKRRYYVCRGARDCPLGHISADRLEEVVWDQLVALISDPEALRREIESRVCSPVIPLKAAISEIERQLASCAARRARLVELYEKGLVPLVEIQAKLEQVTHQVDSLVQQRVELINKVTALEDRAGDWDKIEDIVAALIKRLPEMDSEGRQSVVRILVARVTVLPDTVLLDVRLPAKQELARQLKDFGDEGTVPGSSGVSICSDNLRGGPQDPVPARLPAPVRAPGLDSRPPTLTAQLAS